jgi:hypothetical protein
MKRKPLTHVTVRRQQILDQLTDDETVTFLEGPEFDGAIIGLGHRYGAALVVCYDRARVLDVIVAGGCDEDDAEEYFEFNIIGAYVGDSTPMFIDCVETPCPN